MSSSGLSHAASAALIGTTGSVTRAFLYSLNNVQVTGLDAFLKVLDRRRDPEKRKRGLITALTIPLSGESFPYDIACGLTITDGASALKTCASRTRYSPQSLAPSYPTLSTSSLTAVSRLLSTFFSLGQVLPTHRFLHSPLGGPFQPTMNRAISLLSSHPPSTSSGNPSPSDSHSPSLQKAWIHIFPEGFVHQHPSLGMRYFKWGVSRLILEADPAPEIIPMFISGTEKLMPEKRMFPRFLPRVGKKITVAFGDSIDTETDTTFADMRSQWKNLATSHNDREGNSGTWSHEDLPEDLKHGLEARSLRSQVASHVRDEVNKLRSGMGYPEEDPSYGLAETWARDWKRQTYKSQVDGSLVKKG